MNAIFKYCSFFIIIYVLRSDRHRRVNRDYRLRVNHLRMNQSCESHHENHLRTNQSCESHRVNHLRTNRCYCCDESLMMSCGLVRRFLMDGSALKSCRYFCARSFRVL